MFHIRDFGFLGSSIFRNEPKLLTIKKGHLDHVSLSHMKYRKD